MDGFVLVIVDGVVVDGVVVVVVGVVAVVCWLVLFLLFAFSADNGECQADHSSFPPLFFSLDEAKEGFDP